MNGCLKNEKFFQELLYKQFSQRMFGVCLRYAPNRDVADDIFQEGFIRVFASLHQFKGNAALSSWMYRVFVTTAINYIQRRLKPQMEVSLNEDFNPAEEDISEQEKDHWLNHISTDEALEMVQQLPEKYRLAINLYAVDKHSHEDIAKLLNISVATSRSQVSRARKLLSTMLKQELERKIGR
ncbi:MAG: RNA polymerase sigma factor [Bacteroidia bacterium]